MSGSVLSLGQRIIAGARSATGTVVRNAPTAIAIGQTAAVIGGTGLALANAQELYSSRSTLAAQFQQQTMFPRDLVGNDTRTNFYMSFKFQAYEKRAINNAPFLRSQGTIRLPIPDNLRDNMSVTYGSANMSTAVGAGLEALVGRGPIAGGDIASTASNLAGAGTDALSAAVQGAAASTLSQTGPGQAAQAYLGLAVNPYQTVLFEKPEFKSHTFSWKFMPRDEEETAAARDIFRTFQYHMLPGVSEGIGLFFSYPSTVVISLYPSSEFLYRFKPCVIKSVSVNYAAGSSPSFFKRSGAPTAMTMSIELQEIEYWTNKDYTAASFDQTVALGNNLLSSNNNVVTPGMSRTRESTGGI